MNKAVLQAYDFLKYLTPLKTDCGKMCDKRCCRQEDMGMLLFPDEEQLFAEDVGFSVRKDSSGRNILFCSGICDRKKRPLSCRIYPLFPYTYEDGGEIKQKVIYDLRAINSCEIVSQHIKVSRKFVFGVRKAGKALLRDGRCKDFLLNVSREIDDIIKLNEDIGGIR